MTRNVIAVVLLCAACCAAGYVRGFGIAETRGRALLAEQAEASASEREALAVAMAEAERLARQRLEAEAERAAAIAGELSETRNRLAAERQAFTRRMARVAEDASRHCAGLSAGWVLLYNEALGLAPAAPEASAPAAGIGAPAGSASATDAGVRSGASVMVSPEDLLAHARDYGGYCRNLRAQAEALLAVEKGRGGQAMTQAALQFDAHTLLLGLLGMVCGFLACWGTRLEQRVDELKARQCLLAEEMHKSYVPREDCRERTAQILGGLERADEKLDRIADAIRTGGR